MVIGAIIDDLQAPPPMSAKRSETNDPPNVSAFKTTLITKERITLKTDDIKKTYIKLCKKQDAYVHNFSV
jgi:hypothetical protein